MHTPGDTLRSIPLLLFFSMSVLACDAGGGGEKGAGGQSSASSSATGGAGGTGAASSSVSSAGPGGSGGAGGGAGGAGGSTSIDCSNLPLCDDFESASPGGPPDAALWEIASPNCSGTGVVSVDATQAHSGKNSVLVAGKGGYCNHVFIRNSAAVAGIGSVVYGRFFLRVSDAQGDGHTTFLAMKDNNDGGKDLRMGGQSKILMWNRESDDATLPALSPVGISKSVALPPQKWMCIEFKADGATGSLETWVDGTSIEGLLIDATPTPDVDQQWLSKPNWKPALVDFKLGWESYAGQDMMLWFDDVALASSRIGCN